MTTGPRETGQTLIAIIANEFRHSLRLVKLELDNILNSTLLGYIDGVMTSVTVFHDGKVFVIGGSQVDLWRRVTTFDICSGTSVRVADLQVARSCGHCATTSTDEIFVCGGYLVSGELKSCEAFNPRTNVWRCLPDMGKGRMSFTLVFLSDSRLLAIGGCNIGHILSSCEMLEIASPSAAWRPMASMQQARNGHAAVQFGDRVFVAGGYGVFSSEIFTPPPFGSTTEMGQWTSILYRMPGINAWSSFLVVVSKNEIINFSTTDGGYYFEEVVERFARNPVPLPEEVDFEAWTWKPLQRICKLANDFTIGVHYVD